MIKSLKVSNFTVFKEATFNFCTGLNIFIGENGTGKTHILKLAYALLRVFSKFNDKIPTKEILEREIAESLLVIFQPKTLGRLASRAQGSLSSTVIMEWGNNGLIEFRFSTRNTEKVNIQCFTYEKLASSALFIPPKEILSIFHGFQGAIENRELSFDGTYLDLAKALQNAPLKGPRYQDTRQIIGILEDVLRASVTKENDSFYFNSKKKTGQLEAQLIAEGHRKFGMLAYLLGNGAVRKSSSLFWDEPEANINPKILKELVRILILLSSFMQVNIATHSLFILRELEILKNNSNINNIYYFGLIDENSDINISEGKSCEDISYIASLETSIDQSNRYLDM